VVHSSNRGGATNIWALPLDGGPAQRLTTGPGPDDTPTVDRHGRLAFANSRWRNELVVRDLRTGASRVLARHTPYLWGPAFSPDGREVAFSRSEVDGSWHVWVGPAEGGEPRQLTRSDQGELYARWTPDGTSILYQNWGAPRRIWRLPRAGGPPEAVTPAGLEASYPDVSPDGRTLAFVAMQENEERLFVMPMDGSEAPRRLRPGPGTVPRWSPDGRWIAFSPDRGYLGGVLVVRADGTGERRLAAQGGWPVWWPDGERLAYVTIRGDLNQRIETVRLDGSAGQGPLGIRFSGSNHPFDISRDGGLLATTDSVHVSSEIWVAERP
jgi:TolB protein